METIVLLGLLFGQAEPTFEEAKQAASEQDWENANRIADQLVDIETSPADACLFLVRTVYERGDYRRASLLVQRAMVRFAEDLRFRRLDIAILVSSGQYLPVESAASSILAREPEDPVAWRQWAAASIENREPTTQRILLEAAYLADRSNPSLLAQHLNAQVKAGHNAVDLAKDALQLKTATASLLLLAAHAAELEHELELANALLERVAPPERNRAYRLFRLRLALKSENAQEAAQALEQLTAEGEASPSLLVQGAELAEKKGLMGKAEALYTLAAKGDSREAMIAKLYCARFLAKVGDVERAQDLIRLYLSKYPSDAYARMLMRSLFEQP